MAGVRRLLHLALDLPGRGPGVPRALQLPQLRRAGVRAVQRAAGAGAAPRPAVALSPLRLLLLPRRLRLSRTRYRTRCLCTYIHLFCLTRQFIYLFNTIAISRGNFIL